MDYINSTDLAFRVGITKKALRHYEKIGLLKPTIDDNNGYWYYTEDDLSKLELIRYMKLMGYDLREIKAQFDNGFRGMLKSLESKKIFIDQQIADLKIAKSFLDSLEGKQEMPIDEAIRSVVEEDHMVWFKESLTEEEFNLIEALMTSESAYEDHISMTEGLRTYKQAMETNKVTIEQKAMQSIIDIFKKWNVNKTTMITTLRIILVSSLKGPKYNRILDEDDIEVFLSRLADV